MTSLQVLKLYCLLESSRWDLRIKEQRKLEKKKTWNNKKNESPDCCAFQFFRRWQQTNQAEPTVTRFRSLVMPFVICFPCSSGGAARGGEVTKARENSSGHTEVAKSLWCWFPAGLAQFFSCFLSSPFVSAERRERAPTHPRRIHFIIGGRAREKLNQRPNQKTE